MVPDERIGEILRAARGDLPRAARALIDAANQAGGVDNVTCVVLQTHA
jgi:protein phosphatase